MTDIILHHYDTSPYSESPARLWPGASPGHRSSFPDHAETESDGADGSYRKTPVLQIADIYCDSQLIMREPNAVPHSELLSGRSR
jgi:hypothetical protein